jgi:hypothetical protein
VRPFATSDLIEADSYLGVGIADAVTTVLGGVLADGWLLSDTEAAALVAYAHG